MFYFIISQKSFFSISFFVVLPIEFYKSFLNISQYNQNLIELPTNGHIYVTNDIAFKNKCTENRIYVSSSSILRLKEHDRIYLDYGKIELVVKTVGNN